MKHVITSSLSRKLAFCNSILAFKMPTITLSQPEDLDKQDTLQCIAAKLYEAGSISKGLGAELCGVSYGEFMELLGKYEVSPFSYSVDDLRNDVERSRNRRR